MKPPLAILVITAMFSNSVAWAGTCPNWSSKFDEIRNPQVVQELRSRNNWDNLIEQSGGSDAVIITAKSTILDARSRLQTAQKVAAQLAVNDSDARSRVTWDQCSSASNALMAAKCEALNMQEVILSMEGTIELAQCRLGR